MLAAVSAPSSLAVDLAKEVGITIVGFLRGQSMVVYSRPERITEPAPAPSRDRERTVTEQPRRTT